MVSSSLEMISTLMPLTTLVLEETATRWQSATSVPRGECTAIGANGDDRNRNGVRNQPGGVNLARSPWLTTTCVVNSGSNDPRLGSS